MLPFLNAAKQNSKKYVVQFRGLNYGEGYVDGEFSETKNISLDEFPCVTQRYGRVEETFDGKKETYIRPRGLHVKDGLLVIDGETVLFNGEVVDGITVTNTGVKHTATVGNYVFIFPDKKYVEIAKNEARAYVKGCGDMEITASDVSVTFTANSIKHSDANYVWKFKKGDAVTITGCINLPENNRELEKAIIIRSVNGNELVCSDNAFTAGTETETVTIKRPVPDLDFICESNYRLWGTKGNVIYGSMYLDPFNFYHYDVGGAGESYAIDIATEGEFTGCIPYSSHICFFKENTLHKLYGSKPSNFQLVTSQVHGVQAGSERSMCTINETLFYKGVNGVYAYTGGVPELISEKLGTMRYFEGACATTDGNRYYISVTEYDRYGLYVYDIAKNLWVREDALRCSDMAFYDGHVYFLTSAIGERYEEEYAEYETLLKIDPNADRSQIEWSVTFCPFNETINERKGYSKFHLRLDLTAGAWLQVEIKRSTDTKWQTVYTTHNEREKTITVPILPARCDSVEIRLSGKGVCKLRTFIREFFTGSDV